MITKNAVILIGQIDAERLAGKSVREAAIDALKSGAPLGQNLAMTRAGPLGVNRVDSAMFAIGLVYPQ